MGRSPASRRDAARVGYSIGPPARGSRRKRSSHLDEAWISVDVEASGPTPSTGSLIAIGACLVGRPERQYQALLAPISGLAWSDAAERVHGLSRDRLAREGTVPAIAMRAFAEWVE